MIFRIFVEIHGYSWIFIEIHGNPWISRNIHQFPKNPGYYRISGNPDFPDIHGNPCMPELPYMDIQHIEKLVVTRDIKIFKTQTPGRIRHRRSSLPMVHYHRSLFRRSTKFLGQKNFFVPILFYIVLLYE